MPQWFMGLPELGVKSYVQSKDKSMKANARASQEGIDRSVIKPGWLVRVLGFFSSGFLPARRPDGEQPSRPGRHLFSLC